VPARRPGRRARIRRFTAHGNVDVARHATLRSSKRTESAMSGKRADGRVLAVGRGACRGVRVAQAGVLTVRVGCVWLTVERDAADYWLAPGDALPLAAGERAWIGGWDDAVCCELAPLVEPDEGDGMLAAVRACVKRWLRVPVRARS